MTTITRRDVRLGRVAPKTIDNGVVVPPGLQINALTLAEWVAEVAKKTRLSPVTRDEALAAGYEPAEVDAEFGTR